MLANILQRRGAGYWAAILGVAVVTAIFAPFQATLNTTTVALAYLLVVLFVATGWGSRPATVASVLGMLCFNFFFLPPIYSFTIDGSAELGRSCRLSHHRHHGRATSPNGPSGARPRPRPRGR